MRALAPWAGWIGGLLGWAVSDQFGSYVVQLDCAHADPPLMVGIGVTGAAVVILGGLLSGHAWHRPAGGLDQPQKGARQFIGGTGALAAGIFLLAILFQTASSLIIPQCHA